MTVGAPTYQQQVERAESAERIMVRLETEAEGLTGLVWEMGRELHFPPAEIEARIFAVTPDPFADQMNDESAVLGNDVLDLKVENVELRRILDDTALDRAGIAGKLSAAKTLLRRRNEAE